MHGKNVRYVLEAGAPFSLHEEGLSIRALTRKSEVPVTIEIEGMTRRVLLQFQEAISFIEHHAGAGIVYIHCKAGYSRTAAIAGAYLLACGKANTVDKALSELRRARPSLIVRPEVIAALNEYHASIPGPALVAIH